MGYRHYFLKAPLEIVQAVKDMTYDELKAYLKEHDPKAVEIYGNDECVDIHRAFKQVRVFEFGKLYYDNTADRIYDKGNDLFTNPDTQVMFSDYHPAVVGKEGVLEAIEIYRQKVLSYYNSLLEPTDKYRLPLGLGEIEEEADPAEKRLKEVQSKIREWSNPYILDLNLESSSLTGSWLYEYTIFELIRVLKSTDWDKETILFYGW